MDPRFVATSSEEEIADALAMWPEMASKRVRPLVVSALGDIFFEAAAHEVWQASAADLWLDRVAHSIEEFERLLADPAWADAHLRTALALTAEEEGIDRLPDQVLAIAPHPSVAKSEPTRLIPMSLRMWHYIALQHRASPSKGPLWRRLLAR